MIKLSKKATMTKAQCDYRVSMLAYSVYNKLLRDGNKNVFATWAKMLFPVCQALFEKHHVDIAFYHSEHSTRFVGNDRRGNCIVDGDVQMPKFDK